jgi:hypothetical protein
MEQNNQYCKNGYMLAAITDSKQSHQNSKILSRCLWLTVILATQEAQVRRIEV